MHQRLIGWIDWLPEEGQFSLLFAGVGERMNDGIVVNQEIERVIVIVLNDHIAGNQQTLGHFAEAHHRNRVVEHIALPLHDMSGKNVESRGFNPDIVALPWVQE